jgi:hypothetical protein
MIRVSGDHGGLEDADEAEERLTQARVRQQQVFGLPVLAVCATMPSALLGGG